MAAITEKITNGHAAGVPKLTLYTNHGCPWAHRAHIVLKETGLPFTEVIIPLDKPREEWYLKEVNPRGLVPSLKIEHVNGTQYVLVESAIVSGFLVDLATTLPAYSEIATRINPPPTTLERGLRRAASAFFIDTYFSKVNSFFYQIMRATDTEREELAGKYIETVRKEIEPLLVDAKPFFGGSKDITIVEALTGSFILRLYSALGAGMLGASLEKGLQEVTPRFDAWAHAVNKNESVQAGIWDNDANVTKTQARLAKMKASA